MKSVEIYDTTLRDGSQMQGISFSVDDRIKITKKLDEFGVTYVEGGNPGSNPKERKYFEKMQDIKLKNAKLVGFGSTRRPNIKCEEDDNLKYLLQANTEYVMIYGKGWDFQVTDILKTSLEENLNMIKSSIKFLQEHNKKVMFSIEHFFDGYKKNKEYALQVFNTALDAGALSITIADTNGGCLTTEIYDICTEVRKKFKNAIIGIHCHNDMELAVANSLIAEEAGINRIDGTINGIGERCGNTNLCSIIPTLELKKDVICLKEKGNLNKITELSKYVAGIANITQNSKLPYVGDNAFTHKAGSHINGINKNPKSFEHIEPELVGNTRKKIISELSGKSAIMDHIRVLVPDVQKDDERITKILKVVKEFESKGYQYETAEASLELIIAREFGLYKPFFQLLDLKVLVGKSKEDKNESLAIIKIKVNERQRLSSAEGTGPVNALDLALRKAVGKLYPELINMELIDYKVRSIETQEGTNSKAIVQIQSTDGKTKWNTVGVSIDIIEASYLAIVDSIEYMFMRKKLKGEM